MSAPAVEPALRPRWDAPAGVAALMSTRAGGTSAAPWQSPGLGLAAGELADAVERHRALFKAAIGAEPVYLRQVHGAGIVELKTGMATPEPLEADAAWTTQPGLACAVQVADCMPVLMAARNARAVAAAHAGWRGLAAGVVEAALAAVTRAAACDTAEVAVWLGPCIGPERFEVGADVLAAFGVHEPGHDGSHFKRRRLPDGSAFVHADGQARWWADLPGLARQRLRALGVQRIAVDGACTVSDSARFYSFRRDGRTGRMAAAVWIEA